MSTLNNFSAAAQLAKNEEPVAPAKEKKRIFPWHTSDECEFIDGIGMFSKGAISMTRLQFLTTYEGACFKRIEWEGIDRMKTLTYLHESIEREQKRVRP